MPLTHMPPPSAFDTHAMRQAANQAVSTLKLLANEDRLLLLCQLTQGEQCVTDLAMSLDIQQPTLSQQLGVLRQDGLVNTRRQGKRIYYQIANTDVLVILQVLYTLYCPQGAH
jgi:ArsR family transcriptional regulator